jgi:hypothetical protein
VGSRFLWNFICPRRCSSSPVGSYVTVSRHSAESAWRVDAIFRRDLAPRAGLEPATLRLTGGKRSVSHPLRRLAECCRSRSHLSYRPTTCDLRLVPTLAAVCCSLLHSKGKKRATSLFRTLACSPKFLAWHVDPVMGHYGGAGRLICSFVRNWLE